MDRERIGGEIAGMVDVDLEETFGVARATDGMDTHDTHTTGNSHLAGISAETVFVIRIIGVGKVRWPNRFNEEEAEDTMVCGIDFEEVDPVETGAVEEHRPANLLVLTEDLALAAHRRLLYRSGELISAPFTGVPLGVGDGDDEALVLVVHLDL